MKNFLIPIFVFLGGMLWAGTYSGGSGQVGSPYQISTVADWLELIDTEEDWNNEFLLTSDIDFEGIYLTPVGISYVNDNNLLNYISFNGVLNGNGYVLSNFTIHQPEMYCIGVIGVLGNTGHVKKLGIESFVINGKSSVGGLCGYSQGTIHRCYTNGQVNGNSSVGGLCGENYKGIISESSAMGDVIGIESYFVGGLCGRNEDALISLSYATGSVIGNNYVGGLCGYNIPPIAFQSGKVYSVISDSYATGDVNGTDYVGGFCGSNEYCCKVTRSYSSGLVTGISQVGGFCARVGTIGGRYSGIIENSYWDIESSEQSTSSGGIGKTTVEMQIISTYASNGWDFTNIWSICEESNYPRLKWQRLTADFVCPDGIDYRDFSHFAGWWLKNNCGTLQSCESVDINQDSTVDISDLITFVENWLRDV